MNNTKNETKRMIDNVEQLATDVGDVMKTVELISDLINFMPSVEEHRVQKDPLFFYGLTQKSLGNVFEINQRLNSKLDHVIVSLYHILEELEENKQAIK